MKTLDQIVREAEAHQYELPLEVEQRELPLDERVRQAELNQHEAQPQLCVGHCQSCRYCDRK